MNIYQKFVLLSIDKDGEVFYDLRRYFNSYTSVAALADLMILDRISIQNRTLIKKSTESGKILNLVLSKLENVNQDLVQLIRNLSKNFSSIVINELESEKSIKVKSLNIGKFKLFKKFVTNLEVVAGLKKEILDFAVQPDSTNKEILSLIFLLDSANILGDVFSKENASKIYKVAEGEWWKDSFFEDLKVLVKKADLI